MNSNDFFKLPSGITKEDAQILNNDLSTKSLADIPRESYHEVENYICTALLHDTIASNIRPALERLMEEIRENK